MLKRVRTPRALWRPAVLPWPTALPARALSRSAGTDSTAGEAATSATPASPAASAERPQPLTSNATLLSRFYAPTQRSTEVDTPLSLLQRGGYIRASASGVYTLLPAGLRVQRNIASTIARHMRAAGASQVQMPTLLPAAAWKKSGRWDGMGRELYRLKDRAGKDWLLAPTHEEEVTSLVSELALSAKALPVRVFQMSKLQRSRGMLTASAVRSLATAQHASIATSRAPGPDWCARESS
jgi:hypothetical protein